MRKVFITIVAVLTLTQIGSGLDTKPTKESPGPESVIGFFNEDVTLNCHRNVSGGVKWSYMKSKSDDEVPVPGRHSYWSSSYGQHSLRVENLQRSDAGQYVCRSTHQPQAFKATSAFIVVVADHPTCRAVSQTDDEYTVSCRIVYSGMLNLTLSILRSSDNFTVASGNFTSTVEGSWRRLEGRVPVIFSCQPHACRAQFHSSHTHPDVAKNRPKYIEVSCEFSPPLECAAESHVTGSGGSTIESTTTTAARDVFSPAVDGMFWYAMGSLSTIGLILIIALIVGVILLFRCRKFILQAQQGNNGSGQLDSLTPGQEQNANNLRATATSPLLRKESSSSANVASSAQDVSVRLQPSTNCASLEHRRPPHTHASNNASTSTSVSDLALHSDVSGGDDDDVDGDESNEETVVAKTGRKLAEAALAASVLVQDKSM